MAEGRAAGARGRRPGAGARGALPRPASAASSTRRCPRRERGPRARPGPPARRRTPPCRAAPLGGARPRAPAPLGRSSSWDGGRGSWRLYWLATGPLLAVHERRRDAATTATTARSWSQALEGAAGEGTVIVARHRPRCSRAAAAVPLGRVDLRGPRLAARPAVDVVRGHARGGRRRSRARPCWCRRRAGCSGPVDGRAAGWAWLRLRGAPPPGAGGLPDAGTRAALGLLAARRPEVAAPHPRAAASTGPGAGDGRAGGRARSCGWAPPSGWRPRPGRCGWCSTDLAAGGAGRPPATSTSRVPENPRCGAGLVTARRLVTLEWIEAWARCRKVSTEHEICLTAVAGHTSFQAGGAVPTPGRNRRHGRAHQPRALRLRLS